MNAASVWEFLRDKLENCDFDQTTMSGNLIEKKNKIEGPLFTNSSYKVDSSVLKFLALSKEKFDPNNITISANRIGFFLFAFKKRIRLALMIQTSIANHWATRNITS